MCHFPWISFDELKKYFFYTIFPIIQRHRWRSHRWSKKWYLHAKSIKWLLFKKQNYKILHFFLKKIYYFIWSQERKSIKHKKYINSLCHLIIKKCVSACHGPFYLRQNISCLTKLFFFQKFESSKLTFLIELIGCG